MKPMSTHRQTQRQIVAALLTVTVMPLANAHPAIHHDAGWAGIMHWLSSPDHLLLSVLALVVAGWLARHWIRRSQRAARVSAASRRRLRG